MKRFEENTKNKLFIVLSATATIIYLFYFGYKSLHFANISQITKLINKLAVHNMSREKFGMLIQKIYYQEFSKIEKVEFAIGSVFATINF